ncbi:Asp-tRNA(Asn)/Glu-tRNA(Gln) amidotransferase subunit GatA [Paracoccus sp. (in: a-proteobacteria)]|uniref:Asp-tRNA(Asn)/Glu-tRNA(Gln) amidotransferase subunit GatA n=1 Tax=Paracoccus sp. TaxID=267 RepID=UPI003A8745D4
MSDLNELTIADARDALVGGDVTAVELTEACLAAIEGAGALNAFVHNTPDMARRMAADADRRIKAGEAVAMTGIPVGVKDLFCVQGVPSQAASRILEGFRPEYESAVTQNLWDAGAVMLGKLNMDEFGMGSSTEHSTYGATVNPWRAADGVSRTAGGSSGGSAAAVAAGLCLGATATDTGGSIRQPASFTGTVGLRPTYGRVSRWGVIAYASSLDQAGPITTTVRDAAIMLGAMASVDDRDSTSADIPVPDYEAALTGDIRGKKIGIPREYRVDGMPDEIAALWQKGADMLRDAGAEIVDISLPHTKYALPAYYVIAPAEASSNLARYDGVRYGRRARLGQGDGIVGMYEKTRAEGFGPEVQRRIMIGTYVLSAGFYDAYYNRARKVRALIKRDFDNAYADGIDAILAPTTPSAAFALGAMDDADPVKMYLNDVFTVTLNLAGLPGISVPVGLDKQGLPLGLQLIGRPFAEGDLLNQAMVLESAAGFLAKPERWW